MEIGSAAIVVENPKLKPTFTSILKQLMSIALVISVIIVVNPVVPEMLWEHISIENIKLNKVIVQDLRIILWLRLDHIVAHIVIIQLQPNNVLNTILNPSTQTLLAINVIFVTKFVPLKML